ncbi:hypothetical protein ABZY90_25730 [Streptomyces sp. NPDC006422]|uniref:hypothetical protein n=1 Tax=unclassified Streptomyces TaxID=2593676 RepID=UPI0033B01C13
MTTGWGARAGRAAVFAAVCVLLTSLGHALMSGDTVPWWALGGGFVVAGGAAYGVGGRERGLLPVVGLAVASQAVLHVFFSWTQGVGHSVNSAESLGTAGMPTTPAMEHSSHAMHGMHGMADTSATDMSVGGMSGTGMLLAHLLAAVLSGLWLAYGEQAAFRIARCAARHLLAPLNLPLRLPTPVHRPRIHVRRTRDDRTPRVLLLADTITSRGPPAGHAVA